MIIACPLVDVCVHCNSTCTTVINVQQLAFWSFIKLYCQLLCLVQEYMLTCEYHLLDYFISAYFKGKMNVSTHCGSNNAK